MPGRVDSLLTSVSRNTRTSIVLSWKPPRETGGLGPITQWLVTWRPAGAPETTPSETATLRGSAVSSTTITGLQAETRYVVDVRAVNALGTGPASAFALGAVTATTGADNVVATGQVPSEPLQLRVIANDGGGTTLLSWLAPADAGTAPLQSHMLDMQAAGGTSSSPVPLSLLADTTSATAPVQRGAFYRFRVRAANRVGASEYSLSVYVQAAPWSFGVVTGAFPVAVDMAASWLLFRAAHCAGGVDAQRRHRPPRV